MNFVQILQSTFKKYSDKEAIVFHEKVLKYDELNTAINRVAELLKLKGIKKGDRVAIQLSKCLETLYFHFACLASGAITLHLNDDYKSSEVEYFIKDSGSSLFVTDSLNYLKSEETLHKIPELEILTIDEKFPEVASYKEDMERIKTCSEPEYPTEDNDLAMICYTSGTTGEPKGACLTHKNLLENTEDLQEIWKLSDQDIFLNTLPLFHAHGLLVSLQGALHAGATTVMHKKFDSELVWKTIEKKRCTVFMGVPTMYKRMLNAWEELPQKPDINSMRLFISGSAPLTEELFYQFKDTVGHTILERYGMTETLIIASNPYEIDLRKAKSVGFPLPRVAIRILGQEGKDVELGSVGEVCVRGGNVFKGYWQNTAKTKESFFGEWFRSGDLGYQDPHDGLRLYLVGRLKEIIISGGYNVYPGEIESHLEKHRAVKQAAVIGLPDPDFGERVVAAVLLENNAKADEDQLKAFCKVELASYKCPKEIFFLSKLPLNTLGKVMKDDIKKMIL